MIRTIFCLTLGFVVGFTIGAQTASAAERPIHSCSRHAVIPSNDDPSVHWLVFWASPSAEGVIKTEGTPDFVKLLFDGACARETRERPPAYARWPEAGEKLMGE